MAVWCARERRNCEDDILEMIASAIEMFLEDAGNLSGGLVEGTASKSAKNEVVDMVIVGYIKKELDTIRKSFEIFVVRHMTKILSNLSIGCGTGQNITKDDITILFKANSFGIKCSVGIETFIDAGAVAIVELALCCEYRI